MTRSPAWFTMLSSRAPSEKSIWCVLAREPVEKNINIPSSLLADDLVITMDDSSNYSKAG